MKNTRLKTGLILVLILLFGGTLYQLTTPNRDAAARGFAQPTPNATPRGPDRFTEITIDYTQYKWWLTQWADNQVACTIYVDEEGLPLASDILYDCGEDIYKKWLATQVCTETNPADCGGYYLHYISSQPAQRKVALSLPPPSVWISVQDCQETSDTILCTGQPGIVLKGEETLPNEQVIRIEGRLGSGPFECKAAECFIPLQPTGENGTNLTFWAFSSYGDSSPVYTAQIRVTPAEASVDYASWYVDVLSSQWVGRSPASCAQTWEAFPPSEGLPAWLKTPEESADLASDIPFAYLAENLISQGVADVSACTDGGLLPNGAASACGLEAARPAVVEWQNQFDALILDVARETSIPAQVLKNLFSRESQFWPGVFKHGTDVGLGQLTPDGADTTLLWNYAFYRQFCPLILDDDVCARIPYSELDETQQAMLRGALIHSVDATCPTCPLGIDISKANFSVHVFGRTLLANCQQAGKVVRNVTGVAPGVNISYEDMWRFTLVNYNAGTGCLHDALKSTKAANLPLTWLNVQYYLEPACQGAVEYVQDISQ